jgi:hypothetical protein
MADYFSKRETLADEQVRHLQRARAGDANAGLQFLVARAKAGVAKVRFKQELLARKRQRALKTLESMPGMFAATEKDLRKAQSRLRKAKKRLAEVTGAKS